MPLVRIRSVMSSVVASWRILNPGEEHDLWTGSIMYTCPNCGHEAMLPVTGRVLAQLGDGGLIFGQGPQRIPKAIQCRNCRKRFEREK
jgi:hypothetical protein